jgi:hypothetical protein
MNLKGKFCRTLGGVIIGEIALVLLTAFVQEVLFNGISYTSSQMKDVLIGGTGTFIAAIIAGVIAAWIGGKSNALPAVIISLIITAEMTYLITSDKTNDPIWFDILAGLSLIVGIWIGYFIVKSKG